jgi:hypothetical protein
MQLKNSFFPAIEDEEITRRKMITDDVMIDLSCMIWTTSYLIEDLH